MNKIIHGLSIITLRLGFRIVSILLPLTNNTKGLIRLKIYLGTLLLTLYTSHSTAQNKASKESQNDTIVIDVVLEKPNITVIEPHNVMCYLGGRPKVTSNNRFLTEDEIIARPSKVTLNNQFLTEDEIKAYFKNKMRYPDEAYAHRIEGTVQLSYLVDNKGRISQINVMKSLGYGCDEEAMRLLKMVSEDGIIIKERITPGRKNADTGISDNISFKYKSIFIEFKLR